MKTYKIICLVMVGVFLQTYLFLIAFNGNRDPNWEVTTTPRSDSDNNKRGLDYLGVIEAENSRNTLEELRVNKSNVQGVPLYHETLVEGDLMNGSVHSDQQCSKGRFSDGSLPITALASFPGSGNTWLRYLIQQTTGFYTGSVYRDRRLLDSAFPGEGQTDGSVIAVKTHYPFIRMPNKQGEPLKPRRAIVLLRKPFDAIKAAYFLRISKSHTNEVVIEKDSVNNQTWNNHVTYSIQSWDSFYRYWLNAASIDTHVVSYENLTRNIRIELISLLSFLKMEIADSVLKCVLQNSEGSFHRKKSKNSEDGFLYDILDKKTKKQLDYVYKNVLAIAQKYRYKI